MSVPGVADTTAAGLIAELPELGRLNRGQAAKLVGVAPINRDSGTLRGRRMIGGGRVSVRRMLYMATLVATRHNPTIRECYQRLQANGKAKMTALVACMRKLLLYPQRHDQEPNYLESTPEGLTAKTVATNYA